MSIIRTRWAAIGAAVAVTLGAGGIGLVSATQPSGAVAFVPITPCRVMDTRTEFNVGPKASPLGPGETYTVDTTTGDTGDCTGIPTSATGISLNVTALDATRPTFLTVWATGAPQPDTSSLNPVPGQPPTPNAVTTGIDTNGRFDVFNLQGRVEVVADINGYYTGHHHDDRYYTKTQADGRFDGQLDVYTGQIALRLPAGTTQDFASGTYPRPLPADMPAVTLERVAIPTFSDNCPGIGEAAVSGVLCLYEFGDTIDVLPVPGYGDSYRHGFLLVLYPDLGTNNYFASWALRVQPG